MMTTGRSGKSRRKIKATAVSQQAQGLMEPCLQTFPVREHAQHTARAQPSFGGVWGTELLGGFHPLFGLFWLVDAEQMWSTLSLP